MITDRPGTYVFVMANERWLSLPVGKLGNLQLRPGCYLNVGSAFGPGGVAARVRHHLGISRRPHWHIDHLRAVCAPIGVFHTTHPARLEHRWAGEIARLPGAVTPGIRFGCSDCDCPTHLFWFAALPSATQTRRRLASCVEVATGPVVEWHPTERVAGSSPPVAGSARDCRGVRSK